MGAKLLDTRVLGRQFVDRYELMGEIASGGMATVYLARLTGVGGFQRLYAIKRLHAHLQNEKEFVEMFLDEARLAAGIHHPNVVPILEVGASPTTGYYLVMEYIEGDTFARLLARAASTKKRIPEQVTIRIGLDMLVGLHAAHELRDEAGLLAGVVHRDVSPQNVLVGSDGVARITDFGVARAASRLNATRAGQLKGKIAYMAPEQATGHEDIDRRADVFASGVVIWEGLAHRRLFKAESEAATLARVIAEPVTRLHDVAPRVPKAIADVVMKALERDLSRRYSTCADFADALEHVAQGAGLLGTSRDLQGFMLETLGVEIQEQREGLRTWAAAAESVAPAPPISQLTPSFGRTMAAVATEASASRTSFSPPPERFPWGKTVGVAALLALMAGGFIVYKAIQAPLSPSGGTSSGVAEPEHVEKVVAPEAETVNPRPSLPLEELDGSKEDERDADARDTDTTTPKNSRARPSSQRDTQPQKPKVPVEEPKRHKADPLLDSNPYR